MSTLKTAEQICRHEPSGAFKKDLKKKVVKRRRKAEKKDPENAPTKNRYKGFST